MTDPRLRLRQMHPSGASDGDVPTFNSATDEWEPLPPSSAAFGWFNVMDHGAVGDGTTDDTAAINATIALLNTAGRGVLYFPAGNYKVTAALTTITAHARILGDGAGDLQAQNAASTITLNATTGNLLTLAGDGTVVDGLAFENPTSTTQTAGAAIRVTQGDLNKYHNISVRGFYDCINIEDGALWEMDSCYLVGPVRYGLYVRHIDLVDGGDMAISNCAIYAEDRNATAAIRQESGGGLKVTNTKINTLYGTGYFTRGIDISISAVTGILVLSGLSVENITTNGIRVTVTGAGTFQGIVIDGVQVGFYTSGSTPAVDISSVKDVTLDGLVLFAYPSRACEAVKLTSVDNIVVGDRITRGFTSAYAQTTSTNVVDGMAGEVPSARTIGTDSTLTGGGDLSANRTLGVDTTVEAERIRDVIGTALVQGTNITIAVSDPGDTITISAASGTGGELLMQDGVTAPPVPIENEAQDDWIYAD